MAGRLRKAVHLVRDAVVILMSVVIIGSQYQRLNEEPVFLVTVSISSVLLLLSVVDVALILARPGWRAYFLGNAVFQMVPGFLYLGLIPPLGAVIIVLNAAALVTLRKKKTPEELAKHPPIPITRNYRVVVAVGALVMLGSMLLPVIVVSGTSLSLFGFYSALLTRSGLPALSIAQTAVIFALLAIVLSPAAVVCGALGLKWRRFSFVGGAFGLVAGVGMVVALSGAAGLGSYVMVAGGVVALVGFFGFRRRN